MGKNGFYVEKKFFSTPKAWGELSPKQLKKVFDILANEKPNEKSRQETRIKIFFSFFSWFQVLRLKYLILPLCSDLDRFDLLRLTDWIFEQELEQNPFQKIGKLYGFLSLENLTLGEYSQIDSLLYDLPNNSENLDKIIAVLYRPWNGTDVCSAAFNGDYRIKFNPDAAFLTLDKVKKFSSGQKLAIIRFFMRQKSLLPNLFPSVFSGGGGKEYDALAWAKLIRTLSPNVSEFDKIQGTRLLDCLFELSQRIDEQQRQEALYAK